jgi:acetyl-CoA/propionyl-CoA carboxylase biotin carboxyl carrier protein
VAELFAAAAREASAAFGRGECFVESYVEHARHVEAQVLADAHGTIRVIGTRDCSLQRRYQKVVEEAPAPFVTPGQRAQLERSAAAICRAAGYVSAGSVEFLLAPSGSLSFLEVNTRLQVEHTVTEETTGLDLVGQQLRIAAGEPLDLPDVLLLPRRHSVEFRVNAEDPDRDFAPSTGTITVFQPPAGPGIRLDAGVAAGDVAGPARAGRVPGRGRPHHPALPAGGAGRAGLHRRRAGRVRRAHPLDHRGLPAAGRLSRRCRLCRRRG